ALSGAAADTLGATEQSIFFREYTIGSHLYEKRICIMINRAEETFFILLTAKVQEAYNKPIHIVIVGLCALLHLVELKIIEYLSQAIEYQSLSIGHMDNNLCAYDIMTF
ncbi:hypothetical protein ACJX0J_032153, partial [Zea mays]